MEKEKDKIEVEEVSEVRRPSTALKIVVLVALVVLLVVGILLPIKLVPNALSSFGDIITSIFGGSQKVSLSASKADVATGEPFVLSWTGKHNTDGSYVLQYECKENLRLETSISQPDEVIPCGTPYYFLPSNNSINVIGYSTNASNVDVPITLGYLPKSASSYSVLAKTNVSVEPQSSTATNPNVQIVRPATTSVSQGANSSTTTPPSSSSYSNSGANSGSKSNSNSSSISYRRSNQNGTPDLEVRILGTGYIDLSTGQFVRSDNVNSSQRAAIKFQIVNVGDKKTGSWRFSANLPSSSNSSFTSKYQQELYAGESIGNILSFDNINYARDNTITITADPYYETADSSRNNNVRSATVINNQGYNCDYNYYGGYNYNNCNNNYGQPDLSVRILSTGVIDRYNGQYRATNYLNSGDRAGVRFEVTNLGSQNTGSWRFAADLPTTDYNNGHYQSDDQPSLAPGEKSTITLGYDNYNYNNYNNYPYTGCYYGGCYNYNNYNNGTITIRVDSNNYISESREDNNSATVTVNRY